MHETPHQNGRIGIAGSQQAGAVNRQQHQRIGRIQIQAELKADRWCPACGEHFRARDVLWKRNRPTCRVCGHHPLKNVK